MDSERKRELERKLDEHENAPGTLDEAIRQQIDKHRERCWIGTPGIEGRCCLLVQDDQGTLLLLEEVILGNPVGNKVTCYQRRVYTVRGDNRVDSAVAVSPELTDIEYQHPDGSAYATTAEWPRGDFTRYCMQDTALKIAESLSDSTVPQLTPELELLMANVSSGSFSIN